MKWTFTITGEMILSSDERKKRFKSKRLITRTQCGGAKAIYAGENEAKFVEVDEDYIKFSYSLWRYTWSTPMPLAQWIHDHDKGMDVITPFTFDLDTLDAIRQPRKKKALGSPTERHDTQKDGTPSERKKRDYTRGSRSLRRSRELSKNR